MLRTVVAVMLCACSALLSGQTDIPPALAELTTKARLNGTIVSHCAAEFAPGQQGGYAVAAVSPDGVGRYVALHPDGVMQEIVPFSDRGEVSCHTRADAVKLAVTILQSKAIHGSIEPRFDTTVICGFVDDTTATCWQYSPAARDFVKVGQWST